MFCEKYCFTFTSYVASPYDALKLFGSSCQQSEEGPSQHIPEVYLFPIPTLLSTPSRSPAKSCFLAQSEGQIFLKILTICCFTHLFLQDTIFLHPQQKPENFGRNIKLSSSKNTNFIYLPSRAAPASIKHPANPPHHIMILPVRLLKLL